MAGPAVSNTFTNGTAADAAQVNTNFSDLINGATDGTKDYSINALTVAGTFTANGNCTFGNASVDDITFTGSLASSIPVKTTNGPSIGAATLGLNTVYFGNGSNSNTVGIKGGVTSASYTLTAPLAAPATTGMNFISTTAGVLSFRYTEKTSAQTSAFTGTGDETTILCDATSAAFTVTLPAAASYTGKHYYIKKIDSSVNAVTVDGNASETIDGSVTTTINTRYECVKIVSDGTNWHLLERNYPRAWVAYTPTGSWTTNSPTYTGFWRRVGDSMEVMIKLLMPGTTSTAAVLTLDIPTGYTIDSAKMPGASNQQVLGTAQALDNGSTAFTGVVSYFDSNSVVMISHNASAQWNATTPFTWNGTDYGTFYFVVPITGWN